MTPMHRIFIAASLSIVIAFSASGQMFRRRAVPAPAGATPEMQLLWTRYQQAVFDSSVYQRKNIRQLFPLKADANGEVLVATLTSHNDPAGQPIHFSPGEEGDIWVTVVPEVQTICRAFQGDVLMKLRQLIGLPPDDDISHMLVLRVHASDVFRPSPWSEVTTTSPCGDTQPPPDNCGNVFPPNATLAHQAWIASSDLALHSVPSGYPWTHLGYTYNWALGADRYGASEYIIRKNPQYPIFVVANVAPKEYCTP
jgi:hypothetical protein